MGEAFGPVQFEKCKNSSSHIPSSGVYQIMRLKLILIVLLTAALLPAAAQSQLPETPAAKQLSSIDARKSVLSS